MALTAAGLKTSILTELSSSFGAPADASAADKFATAISNAVINYIKSNAVVSVTGTATGIMNGGSTAPTSGTGTIS